MKQQDFFSIDLPKWPALVVVGQPVTRSQAMEILIRTDPLWLSSNDNAFNRQLNEFFYDLKLPSNRYGAEDEAIKLKLGLDPDAKGEWKHVYEYKENYRETVGQLDLEYLTNEQVVSSWVGGPHGWCDWNGNIGCRNYNIGKWPSVETVFREWQRIAKAFPFLDLTCQLMNHEVDCEEYCDDIPGPVIEFRVKSGRVTMKVPTKVLARPDHGDERFAYRAFMQGGERGCTIEQFKHAVELCRAKFHKEVSHEEAQEV